MGNRIPFRVQPMLATLVLQPFERSGWVYEEKYDGDRTLAYKEGDRVRLLSRNGIDRTERYPRIVAAIAKLRPATVLLDGEMVVFDAKNVSRFQLLQEGKDEPTYAVFDCLYCDGKDLRREPLRVRRQWMDKAIGSGNALLPSHRLAANGLKAFAIARKHGYEGLVAKDLDSPYIEGRSRKWLKVKIHQEDEFVIVGYTKPAGSRKYFSALLLGAHEKSELRYVGKVGTGFDGKTLEALYRKFQPLAQSGAPVANPPREKDVVYLTPRLVAQISYEELTRDQKLRQPVYLGLRDDKAARDVVMPEGEA